MVLSSSCFCNFRLDAKEQVGSPKKKNFLQVLRIAIPIIILLF